MTDFIVRNEGSIVLFTPLTAAAEEFIELRVDPDHQTFGNAVVVEHRYAYELLAGITSHGLTAR